MIAIERATPGSGERVASPLRGRLLRGARLVAMSLVAACSDPQGPGPDPEPEPSGALVSAPIVLPGATRGSSLVIGDAYVSLPPGTDTLGRFAQIRNLQKRTQNGGPMVEGGFDPLPVFAEPGDTVAITIFHFDGSDTTLVSVVPRRSRIKVVRSNPASGRTDVPLNNLIEVVFNQPMDSASLMRSIQLRVGGDTVIGQLSGIGNQGTVLNAYFTPFLALDPLTTFRLSISTAARSADGQQLDRAISIPFTTRNSVGLTRLRVAHIAPDVGPMQVIADGYVLMRDLQYRSATGYLQLPSGRHSIFYEVRDGRMDETQRVLEEGADYTALPCCGGFPLGGGGVVQDDNREPLPGFVRVRVIDYASIASGVNVYLTPYGAALTSVPPVVINVLDATPYFEVPAGDYQLRVTPFDSDTVRLDSGPLQFAAGQVRTLVTYNALTPGFSDVLILRDRD